MKIFKMNEMFSDETCIGGKVNGKFFYAEVEVALSNGPVVVDFEGVRLITQSFSDELLGPIVLHHGKEIFQRLTFRNCSEDIQSILVSTAKRFLIDRPAVSF